jgi:hypothetical protein
LSRGPERCVGPAPKRVAALTAWVVEYTQYRKNYYGGGKLKKKLTCYTVRRSLERRRIGEMNEMVIEKKMSTKGVDYKKCEKVIGVKGVKKIRRMSKVKRLIRIRGMRKVRRVRRLGVKRMTRKNKIEKRKEAEKGEKDKKDEMDKKVEKMIRDEKC